ncbi:MAG: tetratricopeptide repeat protein [Bacteroidales bacterium]|nr:tetratricopeptide repeat protein [Bacteroidales bacterium]
MSSFYPSFHGVVKIVLVLVLCSAAPGYIQYTTQVNNYLDSALSKSKELDQARPYLLSALSLAKKSQNNNLLAKVLEAEGQVYEKNNMLKEADSSYDAARLLLKSFPRNKDYLLLLKRLAICNYYLNDNQRVFEYTSEGLQIAKQLNDKLLEGTFNDISGIAMDNMGNKAEAMNYYLEALRIFTELNDPKKIAGIEINIGVVYQDQHDIQNALKFYEKALKIAEEVQDTLTITAVYNNLGNIYEQQKDYKKALEYVNKSLVLSRKIDDKYTAAVDLNNIGDIYRDLNDSVLEFQYYQEALDLATRIQDKGTITESLFNLAEYYEVKKNYSYAINSAEKSLQYAQESRNVRDLFEVMGLLHRLYANEKEYKKAYKILKSYSAINDSVFSNQKARQLMVVEERNRIKERNHELLLARETKKKVEAYLTIYVLLTLLIVGLLVTWLKHRVTKGNELQRQKLLIDTLLEESESHVVLIDEHFNSTYLSPSLKSFSRDVNKRIGTSALQFVHPDDIPALMQIADLMKKGVMIHKNVLFRLRRTDGEYRMMRGLFKRIEENHPLLKGYIINFWDVTEIQKSQQALKESEEKFRNIFNAFPDIYFKMDDDGVIMEVSPSVKKIARYEPSEIIGKKVTSFTQFSVDWDQAKENFIEQNRIQDLNIIISAKGNKKIDCSLNAQVIRDESGDVVGFEGTLRDITRRIRMDEDLKRSQQKLKVANDSKEKLLSVIAHDFRGAVGTQKSILNMVSEDLADFSKEEIASLIITIKNSVDSTYTIVENLLSWARIMRENIMPRLAVNNFYPVIKDVLEVLKEQAKSKDIALVYKGSKAAKASFDPDLMDIVFRNLISNAIKYSNPGSEVVISVLNEPESLEIIVEDSGIGITQDEIRNIQSNTEKLTSRPGTKSEKGTGLGLIIVREFVAMNQGKLFVESEPGKGTRFIIQFPGDTKS